MQLTEIKALLETTDLFAISLTPIDREVPAGHRPERSRYGGTSCPFGLTKARIVETSHPWTEKAVFGCAGNTHDVERKTGVLVRIKRADIDGGEIAAKKLLKSDHATKADNAPTIIELVVARKAIVMPWSDYQPVRDARRKSQREGERRKRRMDAAVQAIGAERGSWHSRWDEDARDHVYKPADATVTLSLKRAEEIAHQLGVDLVAEAA